MVKANLRVAGAVRPPGPVIFSTVDRRNGRAGKATVAGSYGERPTGGGATVNINPDVDAWFEEREPVQAEAMQAARAVILSVDDRITEVIKWKTPTFMYEGNIASFNPAKKFVSLLFHRGGEIPGDHPRLEGEGPLAKVMRFADADDVAAHREELESVIRAWCAMKDEG